MQEAEFVFSLVFTLFAFGIIYPPTEFESIGLTINNVFSTFLGSIDIEFVQYHLRRTCLTLFIHTLLPVIYVLCYRLKFGNLIEYNTESLPNFVAWNSFVIFAFILPIISAGIIYIWCKNDYSNHPIAKNLQKYNHQSWLQAALDINAEYRRFLILNMISSTFYS